MKSTFLTDSAPAPLAVFGRFGVPGRSAGCFAETFRVDRRIDFSQENVGSFELKELCLGVGAMAGVCCTLLVAGIRTTGGLVSTGVGGKGLLRASCCASISLDVNLPTDEGRNL